MISADLDQTFRCSRSSGPSCQVRMSVPRGRMTGMRIGSTRRDLRAEIDACGYFPELVEDSITLALADEELLDFVVHHEPTFNRDEIHRHVTVLALTPTRLIIGHTDDQPAEPPATGIHAA